MYFPTLNMHIKERKRIALDEKCLHVPLAPLLLFTATVSYHFKNKIRSMKIYNITHQ